MDEENYPATPEHYFGVVRRSFPADAAGSAVEGCDIGFGVGEILRCVEIGEPEKLG